MPRIALVASALALAACTDLTVSSVDPAVVEQGVAADLSVSGSGFADGLSLSLSRLGVDVTLGAVAAVDAETATARVAATTPAGIYDVVAEQGGARATLEGALTVASGAARFVFVDVGQGDATIVIAPDGETLLIDGGRVEAAGDVRRALDTYAAGRLDVVVVSHFDVDHVGGVVEILAGQDGVPGNDDDLVPTDLLVPSGLDACDAQVCARLRAVRAVPRVAVVDEVLALGLLEPRVVAVDGAVTGGAVVAGVDDNGKSVVVEIAWGGRRVLVLGDVTGGGLSTVDVEGPLSEQTGSVDVLRVAHHGSATSSNGVAIARFAPGLAVVSVGSENTYCHPEPSALTRVSQASGEVLLTGRGIVVDADRCDGATPTFANVRADLGDIEVAISADGEITHP